MKRYIWLTIFFVWLVMLSFLFANISHKNYHIINQNTWSNNGRKTIKNQNISNNTKNNKKQNNLVKDLTWGNTNKQNNFKIIPIHKQENTWNKIDSQSNKVEKIIPDNLYIWLSSATLVKDSKFEEVFALFGLDNIPLYKVENKEIYIKQLSWDYDKIKKNFDNIIKKVWWNDVETDLYGDKQTFFNPDIYYKKDVIMLVKYEKNNYLVVLPYKNYEKYKKFIKETLFVK